MGIVQWTPFFFQFSIESTAFSSHFLVWYLPGSQNAPGQKQHPPVIPVKPNLNWKAVQTNKVQVTSASCEKCYSRSRQINPWAIVNMKLESEEPAALQSFGGNRFCRKSTVYKEKIHFPPCRQKYFISCCHLISARQTKRLWRHSSAGGVDWGFILSKQLSQETEERGRRNSSFQCSYERSIFEKDW